MPLITAVYAGHLSRFGLAFLDNILQSHFFKVQCIVLADKERWYGFQKKLSGKDDAKEWFFLKKRYARATKTLINNTKNHYPQVKFEIINNANNEESVFFAKQFDIILSAAFPQIFSESLINAMEGNIVNFHPSYLPRCRGAHPIYWTVASEEEFGGVSSHFVVKEIDKGPIISRSKICFDKDNITYEQLYSNAIEILPIVIKESEDFFQFGKTAVLQEESEATYFRNDRPIHRRIYWQREDDRFIRAKIRAGNAFCFRHSGEVVFFETQIREVNLERLIPNSVGVDIEPGTILKIEKNLVYVKTQRELCILQYKPSRTLEHLMLRFLKNMHLYILIHKLNFLKNLDLQEGEIFQ